MSTNGEYSDEIAIKIDQQVKSIVDNCHKQTLKMIQENRVVIDLLVDLLIEKETIDGEEFRQIISQYTKIPVKC